MCIRDSYCTYVYCCDLAYLQHLGYLAHLDYIGIILRKITLRLIFVDLAAWLDDCDSEMIYERRMQSQVLYVIPVTSILGRLALVPVGDTGTIPFSMRKETCDFPGASCDSKKDACDGNRWWYINSSAMKWATSQ